MPDDLIPLMPPTHELPSEVQALRRERERLFVWAYMLNGANGAEAARSAGYSDASGGAKVMAHGLLQRDDIQTALKALCNKYLFTLAPKAIFRLEGLLDKPDHRHHAKAIQMVLSRTGFAERTQIDVNAHHTHVVVDQTKAAVDDLRRLKSIGVPRDELVKVFGHSGLVRYERLMAAEDAKLIEATAEEAK